ncbi:hypothetical protein WS90_35325 [Burkholderia cepacia]|uniref:DUF4935 domain-containing protein n=1 Tax=Burkholderia cepacia TaxID=292 RepID=A0A103Z2G6_BURCE|nr:PIN domain-containing protein [Burkholderia cepacia]KVK72163.1 hypothetical protein WS90_35325 [Burkholderia cepacia]
MDQQLLDEIANDIIGAVAIDTCVFDAKGRALETGLLRRVEQFDASDVQVLIPDVVTREVTAHLVREAAKARTGLQKAIELAASERLMSSDAQAQLEAIAAQAGEPGDVSKARLDAWLERTRAHVLDTAARVDLRTVMDRYFAAQPPFATTGDKKHEFPDAVALLALEHWAEEHATKVLVISTDKDWQDFCAASRRLVCVADLRDALGGFQTETARFAARRLAELSIDNDKLGLVDALLDALTNQGHKIGFSVQADSAFEFEEDVVEPDFEDVELPDDPVEEFEAVDYGDDEVVVNVRGIALATVTSHFEFSKWDSIDRESMPMGTGSFATDERIDFEALVTLTGAIPDRMTIESIEILPGSHHIELSEIVPDWMRDRSNFDVEYE